MITWITMEEVFEGSASLFRIAKVIFIDLAHREECVKPVFAARILLAQETILRDCASQNLVVIELASHFHQQLRGSHYARISLGRSRRSEVNATVGIDHALIFAAG